MYSQGYQQTNFNNQFGSAGTTSSQYRGMENKYQPVGFVQSQYNSSIQQGMSSMNNFAGQQFGQAQAGTQSYHTANYRGNQPGHDAYLRADSVQPSQSSFGMNAGGYQTQGTGINAGFSAPSMTTADYGASIAQGTQAYHTANYRGNQPGHDAYLRADSVQPTQSSFGGFNPAVTSSFGTTMSTTNFAPSSLASSTQPQFTQSQGTQAYHTANYRGNQPGHDNYLRADSVQPAQQQFGTNAGFGMNRYSF